MSEAPGDSDTADSARRAAPAEGDSGKATESINQSDELRQSDSFAEERFVSLRKGSWESHSFDSEEPTFGGRSSRPSSRTSLRDRRKQFDLTTPTLIDEEDDMEDLSMRSHTPHHLFSKEDDSSALRRTPGASMYKSAYETSPDKLRSLQGDVAAMPTAPMVQRGEETNFLGFGLTLGAPALHSTERPQTNDSTIKNDPLWQDSGESSKNIPTFSAPAPTPGASVTTPFVRIGGDSTTQTEAGGKLSSSSLSNPPGHDSAISTGVSRNTALSPTTLRLREDLGNLLQEDDDDDCALELSKTFRGDPHATASGDDWTGSYVFFGGEQLTKPAVPRNYASHREGKGRRRPAGSQRNNLLHAQQPKPRRNVNESFEFGKPRTDEVLPPQLINFGGAFVPTSNSGSFMKPIPSSATAVHHYTHSPLTFATTNFQFGAPQQTNFQAASVGNASHENNLGAAVRKSQSFSPTPVYYVPATSPHQRLGSEMQATAPEFVPSTTRSYQIPTQAWPPPPNDPSSDQNSCINTSTMRLVPNYMYGYPQHQAHLNSRAATTPSPHFGGWHSAMSAGSYDQYSRAAMTPTPTFSLSSATSFDAYPRDANHKKSDGTRVKRGKKKLLPQQSREKADAATAGKKTPTSRKGKDQSKTSIQEGEKGPASLSEDHADYRRAELVESPASRTAFKEFYRSFKTEEKLSFAKAREFALRAIESVSVPETLHWRVYLELADLAKRFNRFTEARRLYQQVCQLQPYAFQGWLEYSKLEEECGNMNRVMNILHAGLEYCEHNEALMIRALKLQEKLGNLDTVRVLLARLKHVDIHKAWKTVLEGALIEARAGNATIARRVLKYLMHHVPWYGPLYLEAYRLERDQGQIQEALKVVEKGLIAIPRYGPLWFGALRMCEEIDHTNNALELPTVYEMVERAIESISKELVWKVHLEAAQMFERALLQRTSVDDPQFNDLLDPARRRLSLTILTCPSNLRWRVWLAAARSELGFGQNERARKLFLKAHNAVPEKGRSSTLLECARLEEFLGDTDLARAILCKGRSEYAHDWKVWLESVLLEIRNAQFSRAVQICSSALELHYGTGRLWASLIQLRQYDGGDLQQRHVLKHALQAVPKSGEVWCEGARVHLNPFATTFDIGRARRHLYFATKFTPQYGDSFVEGAKLEVLEQCLVSVADIIWKETKADLELARSKHPEDDAISKYIGKITVGISHIITEDSNEAGQYGDLVSSVGKLLAPEAITSSLDLSDLRQACLNADPNYGSLWFYCRKGTADPSRKVLERATELVTQELYDYSHIYLAAMLRRKAVLDKVNLQSPHAGGILESTDPSVAAREDEADAALSAAISLGAIFQSIEPTHAKSRFDPSVNGSFFVTGLTKMNKQQPVPSMSLAERKNALFGNDSLFP
ncbi:hypothetical protein FisN_12Hh148 [Fistulifera solaris]|uniref:Pre-mRNA-processing factor 6 n=1 Tax=Fistulifera solaris TaxID=1519565 RepID=A0A1Z5KBR2_FISSO|nr:hypothetical protein FisN_12Hh148 [Fistulifera solaris]|eukprot:GAX23582.1 hypothetical protein FisN_12Hh148 [Fistulifera solaris]